MDRDQINCLHYLYQGDPDHHLTKSMIFGNPPLLWCGPDTLVPFLQSGLLQEDGAAISAPPWCLSFIDQVENQLRCLPQPDFAFGYPFSAPIRKPGQPRPAFVAIPYAVGFDQIRQIIVSTGSKANFRCEVTGDLANPGNVMDQVWQGIRGADVIVADTTGNNPNVMIEIGMAVALGKEVILISQDESTPFDIRHWRKLTYSKANLAQLAEDLIEGFKGVSARYPFEGSEPRF